MNTDLRRVSLAVATTLGIAAVLSAANNPIYDEKADAHHQVQAAIAEASASGKNIVLAFGANY